MLFDSIAYYASNTGKDCVFVINIHTCKCNTLIFVLIWFGLSHWYNIQNNTGWLFFKYSPTSCWQDCVRSFSFYSIKLLSWLILFGASISSSWLPSSRGSVLYWYHENYGVVYVININTHEIFLCLWNIYFKGLQGNFWL